MARVYPSQPIVSVAAAVVHGGRLALVKRGAQPRKGQWSLPGGMVELGEPLAAAVAREVEEECGLRVEPGAVIGAFDAITEDEDGRVKYHYVLIDFFATVTGGALRAGSDAEAAAWADLDEALALELTDGTRRLLTDLPGHHAYLRYFGS
ncbi:MAG: NUDIX hydrolase [Bacillota bacterium]